MAAYDVAVFAIHAVQEETERSLVFLTVLSHFLLLVSIWASYVLEYKGKPVYYVKYEEQDGEGLQKKLINPEKNHLMYFNCDSVKGYKFFETLET